MRIVFIRMVSSTAAFGVLIFPTAINLLALSGHPQRNQRQRLGRFLRQTLRGSVKMILFAILNHLDIIIAAIVVLIILLPTELFVLRSHLMITM